MAKNEIAKKDETALSFVAGVVDESAGLPAHIDASSREGNENVAQDDLQTPRLKIIQMISDELKKTNPAYIKDASAGDLMNSVTKETFDGEEEGIYIVNLYYNRQWLVWRTRDNQGGLVAACDSESEAKAALAEICEAERIPLDDQDAIDKKFEIVDTPQHFALMIDAKTGEPSPIIIDMPSTKQKVSKQWNTIINTKKGARYNHVWKLTTKMETNKRGEDYYNYEVSWVGFTNEALNDVAKEAYENVKAQYEEPAEA